MSKDLKSIAEFLLGSPPMKFRLTDDGCLVAINKQGQKFIFSPGEVDAAILSLDPPKTSTKPKSASSKKSGTHQTASKQKK